ARELTPCGPITYRSTGKWRWGSVAAFCECTCDSRQKQESRRPEPPWGLSVPLKGAASAPVFAGADRHRTKLLIMNIEVELERGDVRPDLLHRRRAGQYNIRPWAR